MATTKEFTLPTRAVGAIKYADHLLRYRPCTASWRCEICDEDHPAQHHFDDLPCHRRIGCS